MGRRDAYASHPHWSVPKKSLSIDMASGDARRSAEVPDGVDGQRGSRENRALVTIDGVALASILAGQEQFQKTAEEFLAVSVREAEALRRVIDRQEGVIASLNQRVAELSRREEGPAAPGQDNKPL